jgi:hypothetical protein
VISQILSVFKADTSDMKTKIRELSGEENKLAQEELKHAEQRNRGMEDWIKGIGKATAVLGGLGAAGALAFSGIKAAGEEARLEMAAGAVNVDKLDSAFGGLVSRMDLLKFASQGQRGELGRLKLGHQEMQNVLETVGRATMALTRAGFDQDEVQQKLLQSVVKLKDEGLDDLGLKFQEGSTQSETLSNMMTELNRVIGENSNLVETNADRVQKLSVAWDNAKQSFLSYIGATLDVDALKEGKGGLFDAANALTFGYAGTVLENRKTQEANASGGARDAAMSDIGSSTDENGNYVGPVDPWAAPAGPSITDYGKLKATVGDAVDTLKKRQDRAKKLAEAAKKAAEEYAKAAEAMRAEREGRSILRSATYGGVTATGGTASTSLGSAADSAQYDEYGVEQTLGAQINQIESDRQRMLTEDWQKRLGEQRAEKSSFLESTFGKIDEFNAYHEAFSMLTGGVTTAMDAWITGSMSAGQAVKKFIADSLKALASQMAVEALKHGAYALGSLAFGDYRGAAQHGQAAAAFGVAAVAAGAAAKSMGGSGASGAGASSGGGSASASGGTQGNGGDGKDKGGGTHTPIIVYGDSFADDSPRMRQLRAERLVKQATGSSAVDHS